MEQVFFFKGCHVWSKFSFLRVVMYGCIWDKGQFEIQCLL